METKENTNGVKADREIIKRFHYYRGSATIYKGKGDNGPYLDIAKDMSKKDAEPDWQHVKFWSSSENDVRTLRSALKTFLGEIGAEE